MIIERFSGHAPWEDRYGYCRVVRAGHWAGTAGTTATGPEGVLHPGDPYRQRDLIGAAHRELFLQIRPVATMVQVSALADPEHLVEVEVEAYLEDSGP